MKTTVYSGWILLFLLFSILINCNNVSARNKKMPRSNSITLFDEILFYDGYAETVCEPVPDGIVRVSNSKYAAQITDKHIESIGDKLVMEVVIKAACDNYDRIGHVFMYLVDKGSAFDKENIKGEIEIARFVTPFMNKNIEPNEVPYIYEIDNIGKLLQDKELNEAYDFWVSLDIFGIPYAANKQVEG